MTTANASSAAPGGDRGSLPGQDTLVACWRATARTSPGARIIEHDDFVAAVFPAFAPMNNAIFYAPHDVALDAVLAETTDLFAQASIDSWAFWIPSRAATFAARDEISSIRGLKRDTTTLVMTATLDTPRGTWRSARRASLADASRAGDEPIPVDELEDPPPEGALVDWVALEGDFAVAGAERFLHGSECGIYSVGTAPQCRRRGIARRLVAHVLADAARRGARRATLQSTEQAQRLYESFGFTAVGRYEEWVPE
jgi:ribosomal protein S18 acetylase RimI-like enzyme